MRSAQRHFTSPFICVHLRIRCRPSVILGIALATLVACDRLPTTKTDYLMCWSGIRRIAKPIGNWPIYSCERATTKGQSTTTASPEHPSADGRRLGWAGEYLL